MWKTRMRPAGAVSALAVVLAVALAGCGMFGSGGGSGSSGSGVGSGSSSSSSSSGRPNPPGAGASTPPAAAVPLPVVRAAGDTVTVDDARSGAAVELRLDQRLVVRLRYDIATAAQWELSDFVAGALARPGRPRFELHNGEAAIELGGEQLWRFTPVAPGTTVLNFSYRNPRSRDAANRTASFTVTVR